MAALAFVVIATIVDIASYYKTRNNSGIGEDYLSLYLL